MWQPTLSIAKIVLLMLVICLLWLPGGWSRRLSKGIIPCFIVAMIVTPGDIYSMLIVGIPLSIAFSCGVIFGPSTRVSDETKLV